MNRATLSGTAICIGLLLTARTVAAQSADDIIAKNLAAKGGVEKLNATNTVRMTGTATIQGNAVPIVTLTKRPNLMRNEMEMGGQKIIQGFDGTTMWMSVPGAPPQTVPAGPQTEALKRQSQFDPVFLNYKEKGHTIELKGKETDGGKEVYHLVVTPKDGPVAHYYIDAASGLETKTVTEISGAELKGQVETRMSDYRSVEGRMIPFVLTQVANGNTVSEIRFEKIEFNVPIDDALFRLPK